MLRVPNALQSRGKQLRGLKVFRVVEIKGLVQASGFRGKPQHGHHWVKVFDHDVLEGFVINRCVRVESVGRDLADADFLFRALHDLNLAFEQFVRSDESLQLLQKFLLLVRG